MSYPETVESPYIEAGTDYAAEESPIITKNITENFAPEYGSCMTWTVPQSGLNPSVMILTRRIRRTTGAVSIISLTGATAVIFNSKQDSLNGANPQGATFIAIGTRVIEWENQQPLYAIAIGGTAQVTVIDESYQER